ncbi:VOC family protein [Nocardia sp. R6R-6]|uniref:VOC family protein n=1 Tax=Nocardia sp. R6R-6 TaxID=3459303 RepID=UPI00403DDAFA
MTIDSQDPTRLADFWGRLLGYVRLENFTASIRIGPPDCRGPVLLFAHHEPLPVSKNRLHFDHA